MSKKEVVVEVSLGEYEKIVDSLGPSIEFKQLEDASEGIFCRGQYFNLVVVIAE